MTRRTVVQLWCGCLLALVLVVAASIRWIDYPIAALLLKTATKGAVAGSVFSGRNIIAAELIVIMVLSLAHLWNGGLPRPANVLLVACSASVIAYTLNSAVFKVLFGRSNPAAFFHAHAEKFSLLRGSEESSFPSGHMMLSSAFLAVVFCAYPRSRAAGVALLALGCLLLVLGDWHYVSDVLAGTFLGFTAGLMTAQLWAVPAPHARLPQ